MQFEPDVHKLVSRPADGASLSHPWILGLIAAHDDPPAPSSHARPDSYLADCECPDDCPRDHANE
jgi:hypothetical protein